MNHYNELEELPAHLLQEIKRFFEDYKKAEHKITIVEEFKGREAAYKVIHDAIELYRVNYIDNIYVEKWLIFLYFFFIAQNNKNNTNEHNITENKSIESSII